MAGELHGGEWKLARGSIGGKEGRGRGLHGGLGGGGHGSRRSFLGAGRSGFLALGREGGSGEGLGCIAVANGRGKEALQGVHGVEALSTAVVAGTLARGAPGMLVHGRDVAEAMGWGRGAAQLVGGSPLAWLVADRDALSCGELRRGLPA
ncbi:spidroin-1-like [Panicum virgatum]|uniref:spidroin-1-like n=1 Tax=Panicum virgatum TaxID=38727 RepID=UPI0019D66BD8|nr:spidroin-1-like [Panicum virgatum]